MLMELNPVYRQAYESDARYRVLYGGAGSGKSHYIAQEALINMLSSGDYRYLAVRKTGKSIRASVFKLLQDIISDYGLGSLFTVNKSEMSVICTSGSSLITSGLDKQHCSTETFLIRWNS